MHYSCVIKYMQNIFYIQNAFSSETFHITPPERRRSKRYFSAKMCVRDARRCWWWWNKSGTLCLFVPVRKWKKRWKPNVRFRFLIPWWTRKRAREMERKRNHRQISGGTNNSSEAKSAAVHNVYCGCWKNWAFIRNKYIIYSFIYQSEVSVAFDEIYANFHRVFYGRFFLASMTMTVRLPQWQPHYSSYWLWLIRAVDTKFERKKNTFFCSFKIDFSSLTHT